VVSDEELKKRIAQLEFFKLKEYSCSEKFSCLNIDAKIRVLALNQLTVLKELLKIKKSTRRRKVRKVIRVIRDERGCGGLEGENTRL
jgi:hypothetical protein